MYNLHGPQIRHFRGRGLSFKWSMSEMPQPLQIHTIVSLPFEENTYVARVPGRADAIVIDPGLEPELILDYLRAEGLDVAAILNTHGHADHIGGNEALKGAFPQAPLIIGVNDANKSGLPKIGYPRRHPEILFRRRMLAKRNSVVWFPLDRIDDMTRERVFRSKMSVIRCGA